jgi:hypothetical protein
LAEVADKLVSIKSVREMVNETWVRQRSWQLVSYAHRLVCIV